MVSALFQRIVYMGIGVVIAAVAFGLYLHTNKQHAARVIQQSIVSSDDHCIEPTTLPDEKADLAPADTQEILFAGCAGFF